MTDSETLDFIERNKPLLSPDFNGWTCYVTAIISPCGKLVDRRCIVGTGATIREAVADVMANCELTAAQ